MMDYYRATFPELFSPAPGEYELQDDAGKVYRVHAASPGEACVRAADMHNATIVAWRTPRTLLVAGIDRHARSIIG